MSDMKCPFCQQKLDSDSQSWEYGCSNPDCETAGTMCGTKELWQELIRTKELLEIESSEHELCHDAMVKRTEEVNRIRKALDVAVEKAKALKELADIAGFSMFSAGCQDIIEQITALEQKE